MLLQLAFHLTRQGLENVLGPAQVQEALHQTCWTPDILQLPNCSPVLDASCHLLFSGPRVRMGLHGGVPARIQPHITTGRADYFGKLVNRCACICGRTAIH